VAKPRPKALPKALPVSSPQSRTPLLVCLGLFLLAVIVYSSVFHFDFVNFDDPDYVSANAHVRAGITGDGVAWAFTSTDAANWFPVTRLSYMLDVEMFGLRPGSHHAMNVVIHSLAVVFLFAFLHRSTKALWAGAFVAFLFAIHPLHAESVAWISERKDVLSAFFWFLALWLYVRYTERPETGRFMAVIGAFTLGLMSKPMLVTFPFVLLLMDWWPLRRGWRIQEKLPLFVLSFAAAASTFLVQRGSGAVQKIGELPLGTRVANALVSYVVYLGQTVWPANLAVFYPYPELPIWQPVLALLAIAGVSYVCWRQRTARPHLLIGWLWFLGTLVPVIGLVQVGAQAHADRYMYIPMVGLGIMIAWSAAELLRERRALIVAGAVVCLALCGATWAQVQTWEDSETLFRHAIAATGPNYLAEHNLGVALMEDGKLPEALSHLETAVRLQPNSARIHTDLGSVLARMPGRVQEAIAQFDEALRIEPGSYIARSNRAAAVANLPGHLQEAMGELQRAVAANPNDARAHNNLGSALLKSGQVREAAMQFQSALAANPAFGEAHKNLAASLAQIPGRLPEAISEYEAALRLDPDDGETHSNYGTALSQLPNQQAQSLAQFQAGVRLAPNNAEVQYNLGVALARMDGHQAEAIQHLEAAIRLKPDYAEAHNNLGVVLASAGRTPEAIQHWQTALKIRPDYEDARANLAMARGENR
jgi:tetratricopeptide (TPR) repeat protein